MQTVASLFDAYTSIPGNAVAGLKEKSSFSLDKNGLITETFAIGGDMISGKIVYAPVPRASVTMSDTKYLASEINTDGSQSIVEGETQSISYSQSYIEVPYYAPVGGGILTRADGGSNVPGLGNAGGFMRGFEQLLEQLTAALQNKRA